MRLWQLTPHSLGKLLNHTKSIVHFVECSTLQIAASHKHLASLVAGQQVTIEYQKRDRYGRIVGKALLDGIDACLEQIKAGFAWHYKKHQHEQSPEDRRLYADPKTRHCMMRSVMAETA